MRKFIDPRVNSVPNQPPEQHAYEALLSPDPQATSGLSDKTISALTRQPWQQWMVDHPLATAGAAAAVPVGAYALYRSWKRRKEQEEQRRRMLELQTMAAMRQQQQGGGGQMTMPMMTMPMMIPPMMKYSSTNPRKWLAPKSLGLAALMDLATQAGYANPFSEEGRQKIYDAYDPEKFNLMRALNLPLNYAISHGALKNIGGALGTGTAISGMAVKDLAMNALNLPKMVGHAAEQHSKIPTTILGGLLAGGTLAGLGALLSRSGGKSQDASGRIRVTLPTRDPDDAETAIELPFSPEGVNISRKIQEDLGRDIRRRLRGEGRERTLRRLPRPADVVEALPA